MEKWQSGAFDKKSVKDAVSECECTEKELQAVLFGMKLSHQGRSALCLR